MDKIIIEVTNQKAMDLLHDMEEKQWIKVIEEVRTPVKIKLSDKYRGIFTKEDAASFNKHVEEMRNEWNDI